MTEDRALKALIDSRLVKPMHEAIANGRLLVMPQSYFVFLCGARLDGGESLRARLYGYMRKNWRSRQFTFLAEDYNESDMQENHGNLLKMETALANLADCIVVITESVSAVAELGAFAQYEELAKRMLVVNDRKYRDERSFLNRGPISHIEQKSMFAQPIIWANYQQTEDILLRIDKQLREIEKKRAKRYDKNGRDVNKDGLALFFDLLLILHPVERKTLARCLRMITGCQQSEVAGYSAILRSAQIMKDVQVDGDIIHMLSEPVARYQTRIHSVSYEDVRARVYNHYRTRGYLDLVQSG